jgi:hypothetical protein
MVSRYLPVSTREGISDFSCDAVAMHLSFIVACTSNSKQQIGHCSAPKTFGLRANRDFGTVSKRDRAAASVRRATGYLWNLMCVHRLYHGSRLKDSLVEHIEKYLVDGVRVV